MIGDEYEAVRYLELAREAGTRIINAEDRQIFEGDLNGGNSYGITRAEARTLAGCHGRLSARASLTKRPPCAYTVRVDGEADTWR